MLYLGEYGAELEEFLEARNPNHSHTLSLPALFAKPIVVRCLKHHHIMGESYSLCLFIKRLSRYPLFLNAMIENCPPESEERADLTGKMAAPFCSLSQLSCTNMAFLFHFLSPCLTCEYIKAPSKLFLSSIPIIPFTHFLMIHSTDVVEGMGGVANYINEMQRVSETYCSLFHTILSENYHCTTTASVS